MLNLVLTYGISPEFRGGLYLFIFKGNGQKLELSRCFFGQKRVYLKTTAAESAVGRIWLANTLFLPFLAKRDRVLPVIATLLSFHPFLAILCSFPMGYSTTRTDQHGLQEQIAAKFRPGDVKIDNILSFFCQQFWG